MIKNNNPTKVITGPEVRFANCAVWEPQSFGNEKPKYSVTLLISKTDHQTLEKILEAIRTAYEQGKELLSDCNGVPALESLKVPLRDGDLEKPEYPVFAGKMFINARSSTAPGMLDASFQRIRNREEFYPGCYGSASVSFYAYNVERETEHGEIVHNRGIGCRLNNLLKLRDGEVIPQRATAEEDFEDYIAGMDCLG